MRRWNLNKNKFKSVCLAVLAILLATALAIGCAAPKAQPAAKSAKPGKVVLYHFGDLSGPYAPITAAIVAGLNDFLEWYNTEGGGVDGVPVEQVFRDTGGKVDAAIAAYTAFREAKPYPIVECLYQSAESEALRDRFIEDKIVSFTAGASPTCIYPPGYQFAMSPAYTDQIGAFMDWLVNDWAKKTNQKPKLAILTWDSTFGRAIMVPEVDDYAKKVGVDIVYKGTYGVREVDVATQMTAVKASGANWVYDNTAAHGPKVVHQAAEALGMLNKSTYDTTPGKIHRASCVWGVDESSVNLSGELAEGMVGPRSWASWAMTDVEGVKILTAQANKHNRSDYERVAGYLVASGVAYTVLDCMNRVVKELGWEKLNGEKVRAEALKLRDYSPLGMSRLTYTPDKLEPTQTRICQVKDGKILAITDWVTCPDLRPYQYRK
ncbi:MAG: ABC transporter substrate-binding protein [Chloroflexi bacterium]|nr:ABC transporter substrate-binding protein [Chloroflexota bacterium]